MADILETTPAATSVKTGVKSPKPVATGLAQVLTDTYTLLLKTHIYHWNVEGPLFYSIHTLTEEQYGALFAATDELAERIRALGQLAPMSVSDVLGGAKLKDAPKSPSAHDMVADLASDHEHLAAQMHKLIKLAEEHDDDVTADLATARAAFHEKAAWMLRAIAKS
ncbi:DNA starvation/stationary phase protection protein [Celeribacter ethanolicus]|uniref:DNA starvation/stationary phase protection protein n=1 Tax=Celeribacter ethanolicus TaxID=1758178 RepID=A0A291GEZ1_9RHOB|nr:DNA starvation/stationary phase protection protein [Celeribacter ethanolicus]ATG48584.1 DNA starvation/stationary phase protection protein [Celeribacter ethanolicus]